MFDKYLFPLSILPLQSFGDHVKEEGGFGFIKSSLFMEMFGDSSTMDPMIIKVSQDDGAEVTVTAVPHNEDDGVFMPDWAFDILNANEPVAIEKADISELPVIKTIIVRMFIESESVKELLEEHFYDFKVLHNNVWFKINDETVIVEHLLGEDGEEIMFGRLTDEVAVTVNVSKDIEPIVPPVPIIAEPVSPILNSIVDEPRELVPPAPPTDEEKRLAREARLRYFSKGGQV
jgi:hypothetical protein